MNGGKLPRNPFRFRFNLLKVKQDNKFAVIFIFSSSVGFRHFGASFEMDCEREDEFMIRQNENLFLSILCPSFTSISDPFLILLRGLEEEFNIIHLVIIRGSCCNYFSVFRADKVNLSIQLRIGKKMLTNLILR